MMDFNFDNKKGLSAENFETNNFNNFEKNLNNVDLRNNILI